MILLFISLCVSAQFGCGRGARVAHPSQLRIPPLKFTPPDIERIDLRCGAPLYIMRDNSLPLFSFWGMAYAGSAYDPSGKEGLASLTAEVMRTGGTLTRSPEEIDIELEFIGASLVTAADHDASTVRLSCLSRDIEKALGLCLETIQQPAFRQDRIDLRKGQIREAILRWNDEPGMIAGRKFRRLVYGPYPYAHPVIGEPGSMDQISRGDIIDFHRRRLNPSGMIFGAAGDFDLDRVVRALDDAFGAGKQPPPLKLGPITSQPSFSINYIERQTEQAHIVVGQLAISRDDPAYFPLMIMNEILGAGAFSSRMVERIRVREGMAYHVATDLTSNVQRGLFCAVCQTRQERATEALSMILEEIERIRVEPVSKEELELAKDSFKNSFVFHFATPAGIVEEAVMIEFFGLPRDYLVTYLDRISAVTAEDVLSAARACLHPDRLTILVLGDRKRFAVPLEKLGDVNRITISDTAN